MKATLVTKRTGTLIFALLLLASCSGEKEISGDTAKNNTDTDAPRPYGNGGNPYVRDAARGPVLCG